VDSGTLTLIGVNTYTGAIRSMAAAEIDGSIASSVVTVNSGGTLSGTVLTDNGIQLCDLPSRRNGPTARLRMHMFDRVSWENDIEHRLTKPHHPWTNGQFERMNRTIKEATVKRYHYHRHEQLEAHLADFINAYNYARRLKTLKGLTAFEYICKIWTDDPNRFKLDPSHHMPGLNT
jgi:transposase InsO family protein